MRNFDKLIIKEKLGLFWAIGSKLTLSDSYF